MRKASIATACVLYLLSCSNAKFKIGKDDVPKAPSSIEAVKAETKGKTYSVENTGTIDVFDATKYEWSADAIDTTTFYKDYMAQRKMFGLNFINDTTVQVQDEKKKFDGLYSFEKDTSKAVLLNIKYADSSFSFTPGEIMMVTSTYKIRGMENGKLLVETPNEVNRRKVVLMMKKS